MATDDAKLLSTDGDLARGRFRSGQGRVRGGLRYVRLADGEG